MNTRLKNIPGSSWCWRIKDNKLVLFNTATMEMVKLPWPGGYHALEIARWKVYHGENQNVAPASR